MTRFNKSQAILLALLMTAFGSTASANRAARAKQVKKPAAKTQAKARQRVKPRPKQQKPATKKLHKKVATAKRKQTTQRRAQTQKIRKAPRRTSPARNRSRQKDSQKPKRTTRFSIRNPGELIWLYEGNSDGSPSKDDRRAKHGLDPFGTSQTLLETELQASLDLSNYDSAIKAIQAIANDPKKTSQFLGGKKGWSIAVKPKKAGTLRMRDFYADSKNFDIMRRGGTARWRSVQKLDANGKPLDDRQQLNVKAGMRRLPNSVVVRVEQGLEVPGLAKNGRITDPRLRKFLQNGKYEDNPTNLLRQLMPKKDVVKMIEKPLVEVTQQRYKFHVRDDSGADVGEGSIDIVEARPTAHAKKLFGKQLKGKVRFGRVEYEGEHVNPTLSQQQLAAASNSKRPHGAFDVYSNTITSSGDIKTLTGIAGRFTKAVGAKPMKGNKVFEAMDRLGFFAHLPGGAQAIVKDQQRHDGRWQKTVKKHNPEFVD